jgi:hypothetical protein
MISDEKVGPSGVKVRCKKCGNVIPVKRAGGAGASPGAATAGPGERGATTPPLGIEPAEAQAVAQLQATAPVSQQPEIGASAGAPAVAAMAQAAQPPPEWYVAIDERQVGPLPPSAVKARWDAGEIGPETLAWRAGMSDWTAIGAIPEMVQALAASKPLGGPTPSGLGSVSAGGAAASSTAGAAPANGTLNGHDKTWAPRAASALAALAGEELSAMEKGARGPAAQAPAGSGSLLDRMDLPEGGVDPTHLIPLPMKGIDPTTEIPLKKMTRPAVETTQIRQLRKSATRHGAMLGVVVALLVAAAVGAAVWVFRPDSGPSRSVPVAQAPSPSPAAPAPPSSASPAPAEASSAATPTPIPTPPAPPAPAAAPPSAAMAATPAPEASPAASPEPASPAPPAASEPAKAPPAAAASPAPEAEPARAAPKSVRESKAAAAKATAAAERRAAAAEKRAAARQRIASAPAPRPVEAAPAPTPARIKAPAPAPPEPPRAAEAPRPSVAVAEVPARKPSGDPLLDVAGDDELEKELASNKPKRSVYVPPAIGSDLPENVSVSQINEAVVGQKAALVRCIEQQKAADPEAKGTLRLRWIIGGDGGVRDVRVVSEDLARQPIAPCISNVVKEIRFPRSRTSGQEVVFPFKF